MYAARLKKIHDEKNDKWLPELCSTKIPCHADYCSSQYAVISEGSGSGISAKNWFELSGNEEENCHEMAS